MDKDISWVSEAILVNTQNTFQISAHPCIILYMFLAINPGTSGTRQYLGGSWGGGGGSCIKYPTKCLQNFDQLSEDLILTNQCHFKAIFSGGEREAGAKQNHGNRENVRRESFPEGPRWGRVFYYFS